MGIPKPGDGLLGGERMRAATNGRLAPSTTMPGTGIRKGKATTTSGVGVNYGASNASVDELVTTKNTKVKILFGDPSNVLSILKNTCEGSQSGKSRRKNSLDL